MRHKHAWVRRHLAGLVAGTVMAGLVTAPVTAPVAFYWDMAWVDY